MKPLAVSIPRDVQTQIFKQVLYIAENSVDNALAWEERLRAVLDALGSFHGHAVDAEASERTGRELRKTVFERTFLIHYRVDEAAGQIVIVGIRHGARLPGDNEP